MRQWPIIRATRRLASFTLIELLVSMAVLTILVFLFSQMFIQVSSFWSLQGSNTEWSQNRRAMNTLITSDLRGALLPVDRTNTNSLQFVVNPSGVSATYQNPDAIFCQAPVATDQSLGDVAEVGYFVQWDASNPANPRARLCRFFVNPGSTVAGTTTADPNYLIYATPSSWLSDSLIQSVAPATSAKAYQGLFAENVIGFWVQCLDPSNVPITQDATGAAFTGRAFDSRHYTYPVTNSVGANISVANGGCSLPASLLLSMVLIDSATAARVTATSQAKIQSWCGSTTNATQFVSSAFGDATLKAIQPGMRAVQMKIYLEASK